MTDLPAAGERKRAPTRLAKPMKRECRELAAMESLGSGKTIWLDLSDGSDEAVD
ncbi:hypothetical protein GR183_15785 [Stappia sp. GBMRC 2046]|uniref:Uncharacterized protein n=1 Tax=Stappia sediminis TaxID=2692190 RepID=A0A7X3S8Y8_9HYPH|nr:hypothetical protein [Stappia sediminis]MXN66376.1 hypothetical protein [Stappia sediminis]